LVKVASPDIRLLLAGAVPRELGAVGQRVIRPALARQLHTGGEVVATSTSGVAWVGRWVCCAVLAKRGDSKNDRQGSKTRV
jgi:hypothetical protein